MIFPHAHCLLPMSMKPAVDRLSNIIVMTLPSPNWQSLFQTLLNLKQVFQFYDNTTFLLKPAVDRWSNIIVMKLLSPNLQNFAFSYTLELETSCSVL